jgi:hypothetical protein
MRNVNKPNKYNIDSRGVIRIFGTVGQKLHKFSIKTWEHMFLRSSRGQFAKYLSER